MNACDYINDALRYLSQKQEEDVEIQREYLSTYFDEPEASKYKTKHPILLEWLNNLQ